MAELPGGAAVLCLAHDCVIEDERELDGFVRTETLLRATAALVTLRRRVGAKLSTMPAVEREIGPYRETEEPSEIVRARIETGLPSTVAEMETMIELEVLGVELCPDLAMIFENATEHKSRSNVSQTSLVRRALQKHDALLSPQSVCALTALLSARGRSWLVNSRNSHSGSLNEDISAAVDPICWKSALCDALIAVRVASLEHLELWAKTCDPQKVESACMTHVAASAVKPTTGFDVLDDDITWTVLHKVSGLGLSPLMLLAISLLELSSSAPDAKETDKGLNDGGCNFGRRETASGENADRSTTRVVRKALRLLSGEALKNLSHHISRCQAADIAKRKDGSSNNLPIDGGGSDKPEILSVIPGHPAIGYLSCLNAGTLRKEVVEVVVALDPGGTGALPPAVLAVALQSGKAGLRLEPMQAQIVLQFAGDFSWIWLFGGNWVDTDIVVSIDILHMFYDIYTQLLSLSQSG